MTSLNTSYAREYVVVSKTATSVVLRVADDSLYRTYWKEFISADVRPVPGPVPPAEHMFLRIEQAPPEIVLIDQFVNFTPELPIVHLEVGGRRFNITAKVASNIPNTEVPGLFRLDYRVNFTGDFPSVFWDSYVSIQQRPLLRKAAAGWVRDSYITRTLNRLVMEPQFMEALHAAGEPLYGFMQANQHPSIRASLLSKYADAQAWGAGSSAGESEDPTVFITGPKLPQGSIVVYQQRMLQLREPVFPDVQGPGSHMDPETHTRTPKLYAAGTVFRYGNESYICIEAADSAISMNDAEHWRQGNLYRFTALGGEAPTLPHGRLPTGRGGVEHIWVTVDNQGYPFWVDITHQGAVGAYRGHYNKGDFADYNSDDIVSYVSEGTIRLFARKRTDIQDEATLIYPPGHYLNPAWEEIYFHMPEEYSPLLSEYYIVPHTNATNAVIAKTWSVSEEMCKAYSHMVGIPESILDACGAKWSALLFALLTRTRNTFDGLRICMRAVGLDVANLTLSEPSIAYYAKKDEEDEAPVADVYEQHEILRGLAANISTLAPFGDPGVENEGTLRYDPEDASGNSIQQYSGGEWVTRYRFSEIEPSQNFNNRYYDGDIDVLARLAEDAVKDLGDGKQWVKAPAWAGKYSALVGDVISYEIPIYVWVRLHMHLYDESRIEMETAVYSGVLDGQRCGGRNVIELFPSRYFSLGRHDFIEIPTGVFAYKNEEWVEIVPTRTNPETGSRIYEFDQAQHPIRIRAVNPEGVAFVRYWQSTHTFGLLGLAESESTDRFRTVTDPEVTDESDLMLANGYVGVTALYRPKALDVAEVDELRWMYIVNDSDDDTWRLSDTVPFADWGAAGGSTIFPYDGSLSDLKDRLAYISPEKIGGPSIQFEWDGDVLVLKGYVPAHIYLKDAENGTLCILVIEKGRYALSREDLVEYRMEDAGTIRITFADA